MRVRQIFPRDTLIKASRRKDLAGPLCSSTSVQESERLVDVNLAET